MNNTQRPVEGCKDPMCACKSANPDIKVLGERVHSERQESDRLRQENEALMAQVEGLVEALQKASKHSCDVKLVNIIVAITLILKVMKNTVQYLEIQRAKEAVIEAAKNFRESIEATNLEGQ